MSWSFSDDADLTERQEDFARRHPRDTQRGWEYPLQEEALEMSASDKAKPIGREMFGNDEPPGVHCICGYRGSADELLEEEDEETLYCPICRTASWEWD